MAKLESFDFGKTGTRLRKWDWNDLLDGQINTVSYEELGDTKLSTFRGNAFTVAKKRGLKVLLRNDPDNNRVVLQASKREPGETVEETPAGEATEQRDSNGENGAGEEQPKGKKKGRKHAESEA
jgi:hypothetical protein